MANNQGWLGWARIYLVPGLIFQSVIVGGGYGTGREIAEFFLTHGPLGGLLGMLVASVVWAIILAIAFEFARVTKSFDYKTFFQVLLGRWWWLFEVIYLLIALLVLAVLGSAAGEIIHTLLGTPAWLGVLLLMGCVGLLAFLGSKFIERVFVCWSAFLFLTYFVLCIVAFAIYRTEILTHIHNADVEGRWAFDGVRYAAYNLNALAALLFIVPRFKTSQQTIGAGIGAGVLAIIPGLFVFIVLLAGYPESIQAAVPVVDILIALQIVWLFVVFQIVLFGTFIETGTGVIHAINERVKVAMTKRKCNFRNRHRAMIALGFMFVAAYLANAIGLIDLIAKGYGLLSYAYIAVVIVPLLTIGLAHIVKHARQTKLNN